MEEHDGHRERMRARFLKYGLDNFDDHNVLELLLFYALPRVDTNAIAHRLLERFGSLDGVFDAAEADLAGVPGMGPQAAALIRLVPAIACRYLTAKAEPGDILADSRAAGKYLIPRFVGKRNETVLLVCLDAKLKALGCTDMGSGGANCVQLNIRRVVQTALAQNASAVILAPQSRERNRAALRGGQSGHRDGEGGSGTGGGDAGGPHHRGGRRLRLLCGQRPSGEKVKENRMQENEPFPAFFSREKWIICRAECYVNHNPFGK